MRDIKLYLEILYEHVNHNNLFTVLPILVGVSFRNSKTQKYYIMCKTQKNYNMLGNVEQFKDFH